MLLRPATPRLLGRLNETLDCALRLARLPPMVAERFVRLPDRRRRLEEASHRCVPLATIRPRERLVRDVVDQSVLEAKLLISLDARDRLAPDQVARLQ